MQSRLNIGADQGAGPSVTRTEPHDEIALDRGRRLEPGERNGSLAIVAGLVAVSMFFPDGRRQILSLNAPEETISPDESAKYWVEALTHSLIRVAPPPVGAEGRAALLDLTCNRLGSANTHLLALGRLDGQERVAAFIADMCARIGRSLAGGGAMLHLPMTRDDIADYLCLTAETISRIFARLKRARLVVFQTPTELLVPDVVALRAVAAPEFLCLSR